MTNHCKVYLKHFDLGIDSIWCCEACSTMNNIQNFDIHHIQGRGKTMDTINNLMCLCRKCHTKAHSTETKSNMQYIHNSFLAGSRKQFLK